MPGRGGDIIVRHMLPRRLPAALLATVPLFAAGVSVRFDPANPQTGPFPSDALTLPDPAQKTGLRVNLPLPDCAAQPAACREIAALNQLDGFSLQPRIRIAFSAPVDVNTLRGGIWFVALENLTGEDWGLNPTGYVIPINEVVYDPAANTAYAKPDDILDQHRRYAVIVTDAVRDRAGDPVSPDPNYSGCTASAPPNDYCAALARAAASAAPAFAPRQIVAASLFTTLSATAWMESARAGLQRTPASAHMVGASVKVADIATLVWRRQTGVNPSRFDEFSIPFDPTVLSGLGRVALGTFNSPNFLNAAQAIAPLPTGAGVALPAASGEIGFTLYLPDAPRPASGFPVVIFGHGLGDSRFGGPTAVSAALAQSGFATIAISAVGHGYGPESSITLIDQSGNRLSFPAPGRGVDLNGDGTIEGAEGCIVPTAGAALRDCLRQTALDLAQLVRVIQAGIDVDGDGVPELDGSLIYYGGQSLGSLYGTLFNALEPNVRAATLNVGGASVVDLVRWSPSFRSLVTTILAARDPVLLSQAGGFHEDYVLRYQPVKVSGAPASIAIQNLLETYDWLGMPGDPVAFAPHLRQSTLPGVPIKPVLFQIARGDQTVPNPSNSRLIRAANMREFTWLYRHDLAREVLPSLPANPHPYLVLFLGTEGEIRLPDLRTLAISLSAQQQMAAFFKADGAVIPDPNNFVLRALFGTDLFEAPGFLPEDLNF